jgi:hypothetical protein
MREKLPTDSPAIKLANCNSLTGEKPSKVGAVYLAIKYFIMSINYGF